jgi:hypothetical protein
MSRQFRRLHRIRLKTTAQRQVTPDFMTRMIAAHAAHPWAGYADASVVHDRSCAIQRGAGCNCCPEVFLTIDGRTVEVDQAGRVRKETRQ